MSFMTPAKNFSRTIWQSISICLVFHEKRDLQLYEGCFDYQKRGPVAWNISCVNHSSNIESIGVHKFL